MKDKGKTENKLKISRTESFGGGNVCGFLFIFLVGGSWQLQWSFRAVSSLI